LLNLSPDPADAYFPDGMTEELISAISSIRDLRVVSRTSVMSYNNIPKKLNDVVRELNVGVLIEGGVRKAANRVRITVQLINASADENL
ncbi:MAG: TPR end-of-group domain-containing protein, partial [Nitrososphaerales archaeon]